jgi:hypothetical protein
MISHGSAFIAKQPKSWNLFRRTVDIESSLDDELSKESNVYELRNLFEISGPSWYIVSDGQRLEKLHPAELRRDC